MKKHETSAGIILFRVFEHGREFLLLKYPEGHWGFPKGSVGVGDDLWQTAIETLLEETNLDVSERYSNFNHELEYWFKQKGETTLKTVHFFDAVISPRQSVSITYEHRDFAWVDEDQVLERITYDDERRMLQTWIDQVATE